MTAGLAALLAQAGVAFSYDESPRWLQSSLLFDVAENTVRSETEQMGELEAKAETEWIGQSQKESYLQERERRPGVIPKQLYGSMDAAKVRTEPRPKKGEAKEAHEDWRDMKILCWLEVENVPPAQQTTRQRKKVCATTRFARQKYALFRGYQRSGRIWQAALGNRLSAQRRLVPGVDLLGRWRDLDMEPGGQILPPCSSNFALVSCRRTP